MSYDLFQAATGRRAPGFQQGPFARFRLRAFWALIIAMHSFLVSFAMNLFTPRALKALLVATRGASRATGACASSSSASWASCRWSTPLSGRQGLSETAEDWQIIYQIAEKYVYN